MLRALILGGLSTTLAISPSAQTQPEAAPYDFEARALEWLGESPLANDDPTSLTWDRVLEAAFLQARVGGFDLRLPRADMADADHAEHIVELLRQAVEMQVAWGQWNGLPAAQVEGDAKVVTKWVRRLSSRTIRKAAASESGDFFDAVHASAATSEALARLADALTPFASGDDSGGATQVVIAPSRRLFVQLAALSGLVHPDQRARLWQEAILFGPNAWGLEYQIVPFLNPAYPPTRATVDEGWEVSRYLTSSFEQHLADRLAASLLHGFFSLSTDPMLETALSTELVIATLGSTRIVNDFSSFAWSRKGASTKGYSRFVPGGAAGGGSLPPRKATAGRLQGKSQRREHVKELGNGYFSDDVRKRQEQGYKLATKAKLDKDLRKSKGIHFALTSDGDKHRINAPLLGDAADSQPLPPLTFLDDYEDFHAAYRALFVHWLTSQADEEIRGKCATFLKRVAQRREGETSSSIALEVFGIPMAWAGEEERSLEGAFLGWFSTQR